jgi:Outer membrane protein beta-barrel domain
MRRTFLLFILILVSHYSNAQKFTYSIGAGSNFSYLHEKITVIDGQTNDLNTSTSIGANIDFSLNYSINKYFGISSGINYLQKNSKNLKRHYLSLPVLIQINPIKKLSFDIGGDIERLISASQDNKDVTNIFNRNDYGLIFGINYQILPRFKTSLHYYYSLKDFQTYDNFVSNEHTVIYNRSIVISFNYYINKDNK